MIEKVVARESAREKDPTNAQSEYTYTYAYTDRHTHTHSSTHTHMHSRTQTCWKTHDIINILLDSLRPR